MSDQVGGILRGAFAFAAYLGRGAKRGYKHHPWQLAAAILLPAIPMFCLGLSSANAFGAASTRGAPPAGCRMIATDYGPCVKGETGPLPRYLRQQPSGQRAPS